MNNYLNNLISVLSDQTFINHLILEQKLTLYDDLKTTSLSIITEDLINTVFTERIALLNYIYESPKMEYYENPEYKRYLKVLSWIVYWFNCYNYLDQNNTDNIKNLFEENSLDSQNNLDEYYDMMISTFLSDTSTQPNILEQHLFYDLLEWFILIYEMKFIYRDIYSIVDNIHNILPYLF
ncbi:hypothetical protein RF11_04600 [Thelohanellus kitauei]|uniref:Uncharacterized protein n=1 Tax=Thelohanellus kitauei TaxID=669202 RepID=A0A0C2M937_THEKT|nr:hypothetical protein RF11_04600 [Thelohanellus kitauei]